EGLAAAHAKGIIHRDVKPENVFITPEGRLKILDFGLARVERPVVPTAETRSYPPAETDPGTVLGTVGYMSPEQVRRQAVDARSDLFSLGCLLYELLTSRQPFRGETRADVLAAVLHQTPAPIAGSGATVPLEGERIILHCLEKKAQDRFQSAQ